ncbi:MAG: 5-formyltetrahydrofolate cyclo-ligase [Herminiimonas sp.]|nr:5-formyltetrahydrofolate cyclo-ligase [Herminiimonas sp.]
MTTEPRIACEPSATVAPAAHLQTQSKAQLRRALLAQRSGMAIDVRAAQDAAIGRNLQAWLGTHPVALLGVYWPIRAEPDLRPVYEALAAAGIALALPVIDGAGLPLAFAAWTPGAPLVFDRWDIATPATICPVAPQVLLIPCIGFTSQRHRLGYGGGFYDRTLARQPRPQAIGIAYASTCITFEVEPYDIAMDVVITEAPQA